MCVCVWGGGGGGGGGATLTLVPGSFHLEHLPGSADLRIGSMSRSRLFCSLCRSVSLWSSLFS